eukprot:jgi/Tetstr1/431337/TSEL_021028.t1
MASGMKPIVVTARPKCQTGGSWTLLHNKWTLRFKPINLERFLAPLDNRTYVIAELKKGLSATFEYWRWACGSRSDMHTHVVWKVPLSPTERSSAIRVSQALQ